MGSGLILLVIVGAWLAVLVPMALRSQEVRSSQAADRFHDAMRVLSRRSSSSRPPSDAPAPSAPTSGSSWASAQPPPAPEPGVALPPVPPAVRRARAAAAARRRRLLLVLLALAVGTLAGGLLGPTVVLAAHAVVDLLLVAFVVHLRRIAVARAERDWRAAMAARTTPAAAERAQADAVAAASVVIRAPAHVAGIPDRMPPRPAPLDVVVPGPREVDAPAAHVEDLPPARGAQGESWSPVPVPAPTYLSAPVVHRPAAPAAHADGLADAERELGIVDEGPELDEILDRRRAVNEW